jgi:riboflavin biosynthesis pyrimidine reductase
MPLLLDQGLIDEINLLVHPVIVGKKSYGMFSDIKRNLEVTLMKCDCLEKHYVWLEYQVKKTEKSPAR